MSGASLNQLPRAPEEACRQVAAAIETRVQAEAEDRFRAAQLQAFAAGPHASAEEAAAAIELADRLEPSGRRGDPPDPTLASKRWCRNYRVGLGAHLIEVIADHSDATFVSLIPAFGDVPAEKLDEFDPRAFKGRLRSASTQRGAGDAGGFAILGVEGEVQVPADVYRMHAHGLVVGEMIDVMDRLRDHPALRHTASVKG